MWGFLSELGYSVDNPILIHSDKKGAIDLMLNPVTGHRSKHINIKHHVICKYIDEGQILLIHTPTTEMVADRFTKSLSHALLLHFNSHGVYHCLIIGSWGDVEEWMQCRVHKVHDQTQLPWTIIDPETL